MKVIEPDNSILILHPIKIQCSTINERTNHEKLTVINVIEFHTKTLVPHGISGILCSTMVWTGHVLSLLRFSRTMCFSCFYYLFGLNGKGRCKNYSILFSEFYVVNESLNFP